MFMKGLFITFEGTEGSGKTTLINKVVEYLESLNVKNIKTREPGGIKIAEEIRNVILNVENVKMDKITEALLYAASRRQHLVEKVIPYLNEGYVVICDRYIDSSLAYQGYARGIGIDTVYGINMYAIDGVLPDYTFYIDVRPEVGLQRISVNNREKNRLDLESINFHQRVYDGYKEVENRFKDRFININGERDIDEVFLDIKNHLDKMIKNYK